MKNGLKNIVLLLCTLFVVFLLSEAFFRIIYPQKGFFYTADSSLGTALAPQQKGFWYVEGGAVPIAINSFGYRGWSTTLEKPANTLRIAILGDSFIEALQVEEREMLGNVLMEKLNAKTTGTRYEVLSFGVSGYGTAQEYLMYERDVRRFDPDVVVLLFTSGNDIRNNHPQLEREPSKPYFLLNNDDLELQPPVIRTSRLAEINRFLMRHFHSYRFALVRAIRIFTKASTGESGIPLDFFLYRCEKDEPWQKPWRDSWNVTEKLLIQLKKSVERDGGAFLLVNGTNAWQTHGDDELTLLKAQYPLMEGKCWDFKAPNNKLATIAEDNGVTFIDLLDFFVADYRATQEESHFLIDGHWNVHGHEEAAERLAQFFNGL